MVEAIASPRNCIGECCTAVAVVVVVAVAVVVVLLLDLVTCELADNSQRSPFDYYSLLSGLLLLDRTIRDKSIVGVV